MTRIKPFLKWPGNKYRYIEIILNSLPIGRRLIEPFTGSGSVFVNSFYPNYLLAEKNLDLITLFTFLQQEGAVFIEYCASFFSKETNLENKYYELRDKFNLSNNPRYKSALFLYLNRHGYNGLCRYNSQGLYNVPFGCYEKPYFPKLEMHYFHKKSQQANFIFSDFRETFSQAQQGDIIYCDPPYTPLSSSANFVSYTHEKFSEVDHLDLAKLAMESSGKGIPVIISNHDTEFTRHHYRHADIISFPATRPITCRAASRKQPIQELIAVFI